MSRTQIANQAPPGMLATIQPRLTRPGASGSRLCAMRSTASLWRHRRRSASEAKRTAGLTRHASKRESSRASSSAGVSRACHRSKARTDSPGSSPGATVKNAQASPGKQSTEGGFAAAADASSGTSARVSGTPSKRISAAFRPEIVALRREATGCDH